MSCTDFCDELQVLADREVKPESCSPFIGNVECALTSTKALNHAATSAQRTKVHVLSFRVPVVDETRIRAQVDVLVKATIESEYRTVGPVAGSPTAFESGAKLGCSRNLKEWY